MIAVSAGTIGAGLAYGSLVILRPLIPPEVQLAHDAVNGTVLFFGSSDQDLWLDNAHPFCDCTYFVDSTKSAPS